MCFLVCLNEFDTPFGVSGVKFCCVEVEGSGVDGVDSSGCGACAFCLFVTWVCDGDLIAGVIV